MHLSSFCECQLAPCDPAGEVHYRLSTQSHIAMLRLHLPQHHLLHLLHRHPHLQRPPRAAFFGLTVELLTSPFRWLQRSSTWGS